MSRMRYGSLMRGQRGQMLIEVLIALAILGVVAVTFLSVLTTSALFLLKADRDTTANSLARSQLEYIQNAEYAEDGVYGLIDNIPGSYSLTVATEEIEVGLQKVTVSVYQAEKFVIDLSDYKIKK